MICGTTKQLATKIINNESRNKPSNHRSYKRKEAEMKQFGNENIKIREGTLQQIDFSQKKIE